MGEERKCRQVYFKAGPLRWKQPTNKLKIRILSQTSILYLIRHALVILIAGLHMYIDVYANKLQFYTSLLHACIIILYKNMYERVLVDVNI